MHTLFPVLFLLLSLAACASAPPVDGDIARAQADASHLAEIDNMRQQGERIAGTPFIDGNKVTLLRDGPSTYGAMFKAIRAAHTRIDMESFIFDDGEGEKFAEALFERRRAGVEVNLIYDAIGSDDTSPDLFDRMKAAGIHVVEYNAVNVGSVIDTSFNHRDHRKILIVDGRIAFTGGLNVSELYKIRHKLSNALHADIEDRLDPDELDPEAAPWRDTHVRIEGPVVQEFEWLYEQTWHDQNGEALIAPPQTPLRAVGNQLVQAIDGAPDQDRYGIYRSLLTAIALAQHSVHLTSGFFVPTPDLSQALKDAAKRGVDVTLILPSSTDSELSLEAGHAAYADLLQNGIHIYEMQGAILHAKTAVIDGIWSTVGSANLDWRSVIYNNECNAIILGPEFGRQMDDMFQDDLRRSKFIDPKQWENRPLIDKIDEWKASQIQQLL